jgi:dipeptidyl aminopeptidase/acylaminoacyl peptidase
MAFSLEIQILVGMGAIVLCPNPAGSTGYGEQYSLAAYGQWNASSEDILQMLDDYLPQRRAIDRDRIAIIGASYGGYIALDLIARAPTRFRAAVAARAVSSLPDRWLHTDEIAYSHIDFGPPPYDNYQELWERSPLSRANDIITPLLLLHGEADRRCTANHSIKMFTALRVLRREVRLVLFPDAAHDLTRTGRPSQRITHLGETVAWIARHLDINLPDEPHRTPTRPGDHHPASERAK